jgi:uncharacterized protein (DUF58 family)
VAFWIWPALVVMLALAIALPTPGGLAVAVGFAIAAVVLTTWTRAIRGSLRVRVTLPERLVHGEDTVATVTISNGSRLPAGRVRVSVQLPSGGFTPSETVLELALPGKATHRVEIPVTAYGRGRWPLAPPEVLVTDPWGLHALSTTGTVSPPPIVLPALVPIRRVTLPAVSPLAEVPDRRSLLSDPTAIVGVRPYQPGDPLRTIHWPATAAVGTLVRRETERAWARDLLVVLDLAQSGWPRGEQRPAEAAVTVAASLLVDAILTHRQPAGLLTSVPAQDRVARGTDAAIEAATAAGFGMGASRRHLDAMLVHLAMSRLHPGMPLAELVRLHVRRQQPGTTVAVVTGDPNDDLADALRTVRATGAAPVVVHVANPHVFERELEPPPTGGSPRIEVPTDRALAKLRL